MKTHYVAILATYKIKGKYFEIMLACSALIQEDDPSATQEKAFVEETLQVYGNDESNIVCCVGDNCSFNR